MQFVTEPEPVRGQALRVLPGVRRLVAPNPGQMTYHGTNTYLVESDAGAIVIDPGPDIPEHVDAVRQAAGGRVAAILVTHAHQDHVGAAPALREATGARIHAHPGSVRPGPEPDELLRDGDEIHGLTTVRTPGHAPDHVCFARSDGLLFTGDHVLSFVATAILTPDGDMTDYLASLRRLLARNDRVYLPGHGPPLLNPSAFVADLVAEREAREARLLEALRLTPGTLPDLIEGLYATASAATKRTAVLSLLPHLVNLQRTGRAVCDSDVWRVA